MNLFSAVTLAGLLITAPSVQAEVFLPISASNNFRSGERAQVEAAIERAKASGKFVFIDMAAAWCGPCANLDKEFEENKADLAPTLAHFEVVKLEQMHLENFFAADFLSTEIPWFPSLFILNPYTAKWSFLYSFDAKSVKSSLDTYLQKGALADHFIEELRTSLKSGNKVYDGSVANVLLNFAFELKAEELFAAAKEIRSLESQYPAQFDLGGSSLQSLIDDAYLRLLESGKITWSELRIADPMALQEADKSISTHHRVQFAAVVGNLLRTQGNQEAAKACESIAARVDASMPASSPAAAQQLKNRRKLGCATLKLQAGQLTSADFLTVAASVPSEFQNALSPELSQGFAAAGIFDMATNMAKVVKTEWLKKYTSYPHLQARIEKAMDLRIAALEAQKSHP